MFSKNTDVILIYMLKKALFLFLVCVFSLALAFPVDLDPAESSIQVLPPGKVDLDGVIITIRAESNPKFFLVFLEIDNQSLAEFDLDTGKDVSLEGISPERERYKSEMIVVLPNENFRAALKFKKEKQFADKYLKLKLKSASFPILYRQVDPGIAKLKELDLTVIELSSANILAVKGYGRQGSLFIDNSELELSQVIISTGDDPCELKKLNYKHWFIDRTVTINAETLILVRRSPSEELQVLRFSDRENESKKQKLVRRPVDQYIFSLIPEKLHRGDSFLVRVLVKYQPKVERMTVQVFDKSIALKQTTPLLWEKRVDIPYYMAIGRYQVKLYVKDEKGVAVRTEFIELL